MCGDDPKHAVGPASRLESRDRWPWLATCFAAGIKGSVALACHLLRGWNHGGRQPGGQVDHLTCFASGRPLSS